MVKIGTPRCLHCGQPDVVEVTDEEYKALSQSPRPLIQHCLPGRDSGFRELIMTGTHPKCWDEMFKDEES